MPCECATPEPRFDVARAVLDCVNCGGEIPQKGAQFSLLCARCGQRWDGNYPCASCGRRRSGRPTIPPADRKRQRAVSWTDAEWERIQQDAAAEGMTAAAYVRASVQRIAQGS